MYVKKPSWKLLFGRVSKKERNRGKIRLRMCNYLIFNIICSPLNNWLTKHTIRENTIAAG